MDILEKYDKEATIDFITNPTILTGMVQKLKNVIFMDKLGTMYDKTLRITALSMYLEKNISKK